MQLEGIYKEIDDYISEMVRISDKIHDRAKFLEKDLLKNKNYLRTLNAVYYDTFEYIKELQDSLRNDVERIQESQ